MSADRPLLSMYEQALGRAAYARLPRAVQCFHRLEGRRVLEGWVQVDAPATRMAQLLASGLGSPRHSSQGPLRFELLAQPQKEQWTRYFPKMRPMQSRLHLLPDRNCIEERLGVARLRFALRADESSLCMELQGLHWLGLPCPRWLLPRVLARETGEGDALHFEVMASLPVVGQVARYHGYLRLDSTLAKGVGA